MESYYDLLEVSNKASPEVIEKAYKVLAKKYHPDVQTNANKKNADEMMKKINGAYEILINPTKRAEYDARLEVSLKKEQKDNNRYNATTISKTEISEKLRQKIEIEKQTKKAYQDAYNKYLRDLGYKVKEKRTFKQNLKHWGIIALTILIIIFIFWILWLIPPINKFFRSLYEENYVVKFVVNFIGSIIKTIFGGK